jgi:hypothetical protein
MTKHRLSRLNEKREVRRPVAGQPFEVIVLFNELVHHLIKTGSIQDLGNRAVDSEEIWMGSGVSLFALFIS